MIKSVKFVGIPVTDQDRALQFYTGALGFEVFTDQPMGETQRWIELTVPGAQTKVVLFTPDGQADRIGSFVNMAFACDDVQATYDELSKAGVEFDGPRRRDALFALDDENAVGPGQLRQTKQRPWRRHPKVAPPVPIATDWQDALVAVRQVPARDHTRRGSISVHVCPAG